jgi:hypothetical protein
MYSRIYAKSIVEQIGIKPKTFLDKSMGGF